MSQTMPVAERAWPCPVCRYDLRATPLKPEGWRCPECGTVVRDARGRQRSELPWVQRGYCGPVRAYVRTLWIVVVRPKRFAQEMHVPANLRDARRFYWVTVLLATVVWTGFLELAILGKSDPLAVMDWVVHYLQWLPIGALLEWSGAFETAGVMKDRWFEVVPLAVGAYGAMRVSTAVFRWMMRMGTGDAPRYQRRRTDCATMYLAGGLCVVEAALLGALLSVPFWFHLADFVVNHWGYGLAEDWITGWRIGLGALALAAFAHPILGYTLRTRWRWRAVTLLVVFPVAALALSGLIVFWVHAVMGYALLACRAMSA